MQPCQCSAGQHSFMTSNLHSMCTLYAAFAVVGCHGKLCKGSPCSVVAIPCRASQEYVGPEVMSVLSSLAHLPPAVTSFSAYWLLPITSQLLATLAVAVPGLRELTLVSNSVQHRQQQHALLGGLAGQHETVDVGMCDGAAVEHHIPNGYVDSGMLAAESLSNASTSVAAAAGTGVQGAQHLQPGAVQAAREHYQSFEQSGINANANALSFAAFPRLRKLVLWQQQQHAAASSSHATIMAGQGSANTVIHCCDLPPNLQCLELTGRWCIVRGADRQGGKRDKQPPQHATDNSRIELCGDSSYQPGLLPKQSAHDTSHDQQHQKDGRDCVDSPDTQQTPASSTASGLSYCTALQALRLQSAASGEVADCHDRDQPSLSANMAQPDASMSPWQQVSVSDGTLPHVNHAAAEYEFAGTSQQPLSNGLHHPVVATANAGSTILGSKRNSFSLRNGSSIYARRSNSTDRDVSGSSPKRSRSYSQFVQYSVEGSHHMQDEGEQMEIIESLGEDKAKARGDVVDYVSISPEVTAEKLSAHSYPSTHKQSTSTQLPVLQRLHLVDCAVDSDALPGLLTSSRSQLTRLCLRNLRPQDSASASISISPSISVPIIPLQLPLGIVQQLPLLRDLHLLEDLEINAAELHDGRAAVVEARQAQMLLQPELNEHMQQQQTYQQQQLMPIMRQLHSLRSLTLHGTMNFQFRMITSFHDGDVTRPNHIFRMQAILAHLQSIMQHLPQLRRFKFPIALLGTVSLVDVEAADMWGVLEDWLKAIPQYRVEVVSAESRNNPQYGP